MCRWDEIPTSGKCIKFGRVETASLSVTFSVSDVTGQNEWLNSNIKMVVERIDRLLAVEGILPVCKVKLCNQILLINPKHTTLSIDLYPVRGCSFDELLNDVRAITGISIPFEVVVVSEKTQRDDIYSSTNETINLELMVVISKEPIVRRYVRNITEFYDIIDKYNCEFPFNFNYRMAINCPHIAISSNELQAGRFTNITYDILRSKRISSQIGRNGVERFKICLSDYDIVMGGLNKGTRNFVNTCPLFSLSIHAILIYSVTVI